MVRPFGALGLALVLLAGCQGFEQKDASSSGSEWTADRVASLMDPPEAQYDGRIRTDAPLPVPRRRPAQIANLAAAAPVPAIEQLVGLDFEETEALLGAPAMDEVRAPARVWAYNGRGCVLSIFFYPNLDGGSYRALTYDVKGAENTPEFFQRCFTELVQDYGGT